MLDGDNRTYGMISYHTLADYHVVRWKVRGYIGLIRDSRAAKSVRHAYTKNYIFPATGKSDL